MFISLLIFLGVLVGVAALISFVIKTLQEKAKERTKEGPRGRRIEDKGRSRRRGAGSSSRSSISSGITSALPTGNKDKVVKRQETPYWKRRGWSKENGDLTGYYRTKYGIFKGKIKNYRSSPEVYIYNPPKQLNNHDHSSCFFAQGGGEYLIHFKRGISDPNLAIQNVEEILRESFKQS